MLDIFWCWSAASNWAFKRIILAYAPSQKPKIQLLEREHGPKNENNEENRTWAYTLHQEFHTSIVLIRRLWLSNSLIQKIYMIAVWHFSLHMSVAVDVDSTATVSIIIRQWKNSHRKTNTKNKSNIRPHSEKRIRNMSTFFFFFLFCSSLVSM